jgi:segregation and condensation protein B
VSEKETGELEAERNAGDPADREAEVAVTPQQTLEPAAPPTGADAAPEAERQLQSQVEPVPGSPSEGAGALFSASTEPVEAPVAGSDAPVLPEDAPPAPAELSAPGLEGPDEASFSIPAEPSGAPVFDVLAIPAATDAGVLAPASAAVEVFVPIEPDRLKAKIEALLFTSAVPLKLADLMGLLDRPRVIIQKALKELFVDYTTRDGALTIAKQAGGFAIVLKNDYQDVASLLMPPELEPAALKTLSVIAVHQPLAQAKLVDLRGSSAYEHVKALVEKGMVRRRKDGNTYILRTTKLFATRFRVEDDPERIREAMAHLERQSLELAAGREARSATPASQAAPVETPSEAAPAEPVAAPAEPPPESSGS